MPITDNRIINFLFNHKDQIDELYQVMSSEDVKTNFDSRSEQVRNALHGLIDDLLSIQAGDSGARNIGVEPIEGLPGATVFEVLSSVKQALTTIVLGTVPDNTINNDKLTTDIKIGSLASLQTGAKADITSSINELLNMITTLETETQNALSTDNVSATPEAGKLLKLNQFAKFDVSITGDAHMLDGKHAALPLSTTEKADLAGAINELYDNKLGKDQTATYKAPNKLLYTDANGDLKTDITGNAKYLGWKTKDDFAPSGYGLGTTAKDISAVDLNTVKTTGFYMAWGSPNQPPSLPVNSTNWAYYIVIRHNDLFVSQIATEFSSGNTWVRVNVDGTWREWRRFNNNTEMIGQVSFFAMATAPTGWLICNGATLNRTSYTDLFTAIGTTYGAGDGTTTFVIPDLRGEFLRGFDGGRGVDTGRTLGSAQSHAYGSHNHTGSTSTDGHHEHHGLKYAEGIPVALSSYNGYSSGYSTGYSSVNVDPNILWVAGAGNHAHSFTTNNAGSAETRPRNVALLPCIKF